MNIFEDPELREALKKFSNWPTYPQLYVNGELVGGCDIVLDMHRSGELKKLLSEAGALRPKTAHGFGNAALKRRRHVDCRLSVRSVGRRRSTAPARAHRRLRHTPSSALQTSQKMSAVRSAS